jgi:hypothetical protein
MKVGDMVKLPSKLGVLIGCSNLLGIVMMLHSQDEPIAVVLVMMLHSQDEPIAVVQWFSIKGTMQHRIDMLEVVNESR